MSLPVFSLVRRQDHVRALAALEIIPENPAFPAIVSCPLCHQNTLHVFDDILTDGLWLHCTKCQAHGNIITFGGIIWKSGIRETIEKFVNFGLIKESDASRQLGDCIRADEKAQAADLFWETAVSQLWSHGDDVTACRLSELGLRPEARAGDGLVGVARPDEIDALCDELGRRKITAVRNRGPSIVFPYYDMPGRLSGFLLLQHDDDFKEKKTFIGVAYRTTSMDAGYFLLNHLLALPPELFRGKQFVVEDPLWALRAYCAHVINGVQCPPIVASYGGNDIKSTGRCWSALFPATRFFQSNGVTPAAVSQACNSRGYVCPVPVDSDNPPVTQNVTYCLRRLRIIHNSAQSWQKSLEDALLGLTDTGAYAFATKLNIPHEKLHAFFDNRRGRFSEELRSRTLAGLRYQPVTKGQIFGRSSIVARDGKWWTVTGNLICDAQIVITKIIQLDNGEQLYRGHIFRGDTQIDFTEPAVVIAKQGLLAFAHSYAATQKVLISFDRQWNKKSLLAALQLQPPQIENISTHIGWDETANMFRFGSYAVTTTGEIESTPTFTGKTKISFPEPGIAAPDLIQSFLTPGTNNSFVWAVTAALFADIIAPILRKDPRTTAIHGPAFDAARKLGEAIGCDYVQTDAIHKNSASVFLCKQVAAHEWPFFAASAFNDNLFAAATNKYYNTQAFVATSKRSAAIGVGYGWQEIAGEHFPPLSTNFSGFCHLLPMYIQHSLRSRMRLSLPNTDLTENVLTDLHQWLQELYGQTFNLQHAKTQLILPNQAHDALFREINTAILEGSISVIPRPRRVDQPSNYILRRKETWWINRKAVDNLCYRSKNIVPNWLKIIDLLVAAGVFVEEEFIHKMPGIVVRGKWCDQFLATGAATGQKEAG